MNFGYEKRVFSPSSALEHTSITPILKLYNYARKNNIAIFFITARTEKFRHVTTESLLKAGYKDWAGLYFRPEHDKQQSAVPYKAGKRREIIRKGYDIVLNIGDQQSDLEGGYADKTYKLPNPFYFTP